MTLSPKEKMAIPRTHMPEQNASRRATNFEEVNQGLEEAAAVKEAQRCIQCKNRPCVGGCPVAVRIPEFLAALAEGDFRGAAEILRADNALPATTGRVCPQEKQCEAKCVRGAKGEAVAIGWLERFVADWAARNLEAPKPPTRKTGFKVCVVGSGPGGLTAAIYLARYRRTSIVIDAGNSRAKWIPKSHNCPGFPSAAPRPRHRTPGPRSHSRPVRRARWPHARGRRRRTCPSCGRFGARA